MRVVLVQMPWGALDTPSLAVGILDSVARAAGHETVVRYANLDFADWAAAELGLGFEGYDFFSDRSYFVGLGDWVFSGPLYAEEDGADGADGKGGGSEAEFAPDYLDYLRKNGVTPERLELARSVRLRAGEFVAWLAASLADLEPDVVGFTTTFQQNTASLAAARAFKRLRPQAAVVVRRRELRRTAGRGVAPGLPVHRLRRARRGRDGLSGAALGPGRGRRDRTPPQGRLRALLPHGRRRPDRRTRCRRVPLPPAAMARPNHDAYFDRLQHAVAAAWIEPKLVVEGARGCWWGEKHHCTLLRPQRLLDAVPQQAARRLRGRGPAPGPAAPGPGLPGRRQHPGHGLLRHGAAGDRRDRLRPAAALRDQGQPAARAVRRAPRLRRRAGAARHREPVHAGPAHHGQGRDRLPERPLDARRAERRGVGELELPLRLPGRVRAGLRLRHRADAGAAPPGPAGRALAHRHRALQPLFRQARTRLRPAAPGGRSTGTCTGCPRAS